MKSKGRLMGVKCHDSFLAMRDASRHEGNSPLTMITAYTHRHKPREAIDTLPTESGVKSGFCVGRRAAGMMLAHSNECK